jgi:hypothetical protein
MSCVEKRKRGEETKREIGKTKSASLLNEMLRAYSFFFEENVSPVVAPKWKKRFY